MLRKKNNYDPIRENLERLPPLLYKYRKIDSDEFYLSMITKGEIYFSSGRHFNDPFENYFIPDSTASKLSDNELLEYIKAKTAQRFPDVNKDQKEELEKKAFERFKHHRTDPYKIASELHEMQFDRFGILSLAKTATSLPMWAYYSDNHEGICVGIKPEILGLFQDYLFMEHNDLLVLYDVDYTDKIPIVNIDTPLDGVEQEQSLDTTEAINYIKSDQWSHEEEIRLIYWNKVDRAFELGRQAIGEVILGLKISEDNVKKIVTGLIECGSDAVLKRAIKSKGKYGLEFQEIDY